jgi:toxin FitB
MSWLLDTNVLSELRKGAKCDPQVRQWAVTSALNRHWISVLSVGEIRKGIELLRRKSPDQCPAFERWLDSILTLYDKEILPITVTVANRWGNLMAVRPLPVIDGLLAATALEHNLTLVTRNTADFAQTGVRLHNPFD